ncbi:MAG: STAS domain-containing protein [Acidimicrobiia bacterium]
MAGEAVAFTEVVDSRKGSIRARGHLTVQGADLLSGAVLALHDRGHRRVLLDLQGLHGYDAAGLLMLQHLQVSMAADGGTLIVMHAPAYSGR